MTKKIIVYGATDCEGCIKLKQLLDDEGIHYGFVDVLGGLAHLKKFLNLRDQHPDVFLYARENGKIGIPAVVIDDAAVYAESDTPWDMAIFR